jgi:hypothetical protein
MRIEIVRTQESSAATISKEAQSDAAVPGAKVGERASPATPSGGAEVWTWGTCDRSVANIGADGRENCTAVVACRPKRAVVLRFLGRSERAFLW